MPKNQKTIMDFSWYSWNPFYQFFVFELMLGIGMYSGDHKETFGMNFVP